MSKKSPDRDRRAATSVGSPGAETAQGSSAPIAPPGWLLTDSGVAVSNRSRLAAARIRRTDTSASQSPVRVATEERPLGELLALPSRPSAVGLEWLHDIVAIDADGRVRLGDATASHGWNDSLPLAVSNEECRLVVEPARSGRGISLDVRGRLTLPLQWRRLHGLTYGARVVVSTSASSARVVIAPIGVIDAVVGSTSRR